MERLPHWSMRHHWSMRLEPDAWRFDLSGSGCWALFDC